MVEILMTSAITQMQFRQRDEGIPPPLSRTDLLRLVACVALIAMAVAALDLISLPGPGD